MPRTLRIRSSGDDVKFLQEQLNSRPLTARPLLAADGKFGAKTRSQLQEYQVNNALTVAKTTGFCVLGRDLYDRQGARVILRGGNTMSVFDNDDPIGFVSFPGIKQAGANTVGRPKR